MLATPGMGAPIIQREQYNLIIKSHPVYFQFGAQWKKGVHGRGVYLIGDFYVGVSERIKHRIKEHLVECKHRKKPDAFMKAIQRYWGYSVPVFLLSEDTSQEYNYAKYLTEQGFPLVNTLQRCNGYEVVSEQNKVNAAISFLTQRGYTVSKNTEI